MPELIKSTPRVKAVVMESDPELSIGVSEKGGISIYGLQRFPVTMYYEQWCRLIPRETVDLFGMELHNFASQQKEHLSNGRPQVEKASKPELITLDSVSESALDAVIAEAKTANDFDKAVKYATIKATAKSQGGKIAVEDMIEVYKLRTKQ